MRTEYITDDTIIKVTVEPSAIGLVGDIEILKSSLSSVIDKTDEINTVVEDINEKINTRYIESTEMTTGIFYYFWFRTNTCSTKS